MAYCYECGSQVAENDVFCPYCGISIKPVSVGDGDDVSLDKTVAISGGDLPELPELPVSAKIETPKAEEISVAEFPQIEESVAEIAPLQTEAEIKEIAPLEPEFQTSTGELAVSNTEENINLITESVEIPSELLADEPTPQPTVSDVVVIAPLVEEKIEEKIETQAETVPDDDADLPDPSYVEILKPTEDKPEVVETVVEEPINK